MSLMNSRGGGNDEMSMEDILASIREYVSTTQDKTPNEKTKVIHLNEPAEEMEMPDMMAKSPFSKIQEMKKKKESNVMECLKSIIFEWLDSRPEFVEKAIHKAIQKELEDI